MASNIMLAAYIKVLLYYYCRLTHAYPFYSPMISTENGNVKITSTGDVVLQPGGDGAVQVLTSSGEVMNMTGAQGPPVRFSGVHLILYFIVGVTFLVIPRVRVCACVCRLQQLLKDQ